jgi:hypothetical protein
MSKLIIGLIFMGNLLFANVGIVKDITGTVEMKRQGKIIRIKRGTTLRNSDIIITKSKSSVGIIFDDGSRLSLGEKAIFIINKFIVKPSKKKYKVDLELKKGKAMFSSGKIGKLSPESFKFRIPEGAIGIRGTQFVVEVK